MIQAWPRIDARLRIQAGGLTHLLIGRNSLQRKQFDTNSQHCLTNVNVTSTKATRFFYTAHIITLQNMHRYKTQINRCMIAKIH